jgi:flagellar biosynthesis protein FlhG
MRREIDQAAGLRRSGGARVVAVASGKGGVGKTTVAVNLAVSLGLQGRRVILVDADFGLANVDVLLGVQPAAHLGQWLDGQVRLEDLLLAVQENVHLVAASSGARRMADLDEQGRRRILAALQGLRRQADWMVLDLGAGIAPSVREFAALADEVLVVVCDDPASLTDAYALIKILHQEEGVLRFGVLANQIRDARAGDLLFARLARVVERFLAIPLIFRGAIPLDGRVRHALERQHALVSCHPHAAASLAFKRLARAVDKLNGGELGPSAPLHCAGMTPSPG